MALNQADHVICISNSTAKDLARFYPEVSSKTSVVHLGAEHLTFSATSPREKNDHYAMFVGERDFYKNFRGVLDAMRSDPWPRGLGLVVIGKPFKQYEIDLVKGIWTNQSYSPCRTCIGR